MRRGFPIGVLVGLVSAAALAAPFAVAAPSLDSLPPRVRDQLLDLGRACDQAGGRTGSLMRAVELVDLDGDGTPDVIVDEARVPCAGREPGAACGLSGCQVTVTLSDGGRWRPAFDVVGGYCLDLQADPPRLVTIQRQYRVDGSAFTLNVRYRFRNGMAFQERGGSC